MSANKYADNKQKNLWKNFSPASWLGDQDNVDHLLLWVTYFRRNFHRFAMTYLGLSLYPYQMFMLYWLGISEKFVCIAARSAAKSYILAVYACCKAILYPGSQIVIASGTKSQAKTIVSQKIKIELQNQSPILRAEIDKISDNQNDISVTFKNGSIIRVVPASENARGGRSTVMIYEECRLVNKSVIDSILKPFQIVRQVPYMVLPEYASNPDLLEEATSVFISSSWFKNHWMSSEIESAAQSMLDLSGGCLFSFDYSITLKHNIKTRSFLEEAAKSTDPLTWSIEYENLRPAENTAAYFTYDMFTKSQKIKNVFYPRRFLQTKYKCPIARMEGELRVVTCDIAMISGNENDNSVFTCIRMLPESTSGDDKNKFGYRIQVSYIESHNGKDTLSQVIRIKQLESDFDADYIVLDSRSFGISIYDTGARVVYDDERGIEYPPWKCMNNQELANHVNTPGARENLFAITANLKLNNDMAVNMRDLLTSGKVELPVSMAEAEEILLQNSDYISTTDPYEILWWRSPYMETNLMIEESVSLVYEKLEQSGIVRLSETSGNRKDRYVSLAMGLYFATLLSRDLENKRTVNYDKFSLPVSDLSFYLKGVK